MIIIFEIIKNLFLKWYFYFLVSLFVSNVINPIKNYFYYCVEEEGVLFAFECPKYSFGEILREIKTAKEIALKYEDLPTVDQVWMFCQEDSNRYLDLISFARKYLNEKLKTVYTWEDKQRFLYEYQVIQTNIRMYDLMDDMKRNYITLHAKRIKLAEIKELGGFKKYEDIKLPQIVPPEFFPKIQK